MINLKRINDLVICVIDGKIYSRNNTDNTVWLKILETKEELIQDETPELMELFLDLIIPERVSKKLAEDESKKKALKESQLELDFATRMRKAKRIVDISGLFEYDQDGITYLKGFKYPMPKILVEALLDAHYNPTSNYTVNSLVNFWKYLLLNPDKHVRNGLFKWISTGQFALTEDGNIISYRNVEVKKVSTSKVLQDFISESWSKVKRWKKSAKNYDVYKDSDSNYSIYPLKDRPDWNFEDLTLLGNLSEMYSDLGTEEDVTIFTDQHTRSMEIKLGEPVSIDRKLCDNDPDASCSRGLHQKTSAHGWNFGSNALVCLTNPYHVVAIPSYDYSKFRCCQYLPISKAEVVDYSIVEFSPGTYNIPYNGLESLVDLLKTTSLKELQEKGDISNELVIDDFEFVMKEAKNIINKRIIKL